MYLAWAFGIKGYAHPWECSKRVVTDAVMEVGMGNGAAKKHPTQRVHGRQVMKESSLAGVTGV